MTGVSSGVLGIDAKNMINLANASAQELLGLREKDLVGGAIEKIMPEVAALLAQAHARPQKTTQGEIPFSQPNGIKLFFHARIVIETVGEEDVGAIVTFDDITELQSAQRKAAWSDVARRIAHEIKNPLTPIHLSAERLKRKYLKQISEGPEAFIQYTDTILRNVEDIGRMVNEFSAFARMPEPILKSGNLVRDIEEALFHHRHTYPSIQMNFVCGARDKFQTYYDAQQIRQALSNLIQNAADSIDARIKAEQGGAQRIDVLLSFYGADEIVIAVTDSGLGLPKGENPTRLTEPYVTHKPKGTGLGLAIVKKIMEDHEGALLVGTPDWLQSLEGFEDLGGATVALLMPLRGAKDENLDEKIKAA